MFELWSRFSDGGAVNLSYEESLPSLFLHILLSLLLHVLQFALEA